MSVGFDAYHKWLGIPAEDQPADHYRLLGIQRFESDPDVIEAAAEQRTLLLRNYQIGKHSGLSQKLLNEVAAAKICLLRPDKRAAYDAALRGQMAAQAAAPTPSPDDSFNRELAGIVDEGRKAALPRTRRKRFPPFWAITAGLAGLSVLVVVGLLPRGAAPEKKAAWAPPGKANDTTLHGAQPATPYLRPASNPSVVSHSLGPVDEKLETRPKVAAAPPQAAQASPDDAIPNADAISVGEVLVMPTSSAIMCIAITPDGRYALTPVYDSRIFLWGLPRGKLRSQYTAGATCDAAALSPDGRYAAYADRNNLLTLRDLQTAVEPRKIETTGTIFGISFLPDGKSVLTAGRTKPSVRLWDAESGQELRAFGPPNETRVICISPDGRSAAVADANRTPTLHLLEINSGRETLTMRGHYAEIRAMVFAPDGRSLLSGDNGGTVHRWSISNGQSLQRFTNQQHGLRGLDVSHNGRYVLCSGNHGAIYLWDMVAGREVYSYQLGKQSEGLLVRFLPDNRFALIGGAMNVHLWRLPLTRDGELIPQPDASATPISPQRRP
jgi:WD40 repeat protein